MKEFRNSFNHFDKVGGMAISIVPFRAFPYDGVVFQQLWRGLLQFEHGIQKQIKKTRRFISQYLLLMGELKSEVSFYTQQTSANTISM